jgi:hypothetical protein
MMGTILQIGLFSFLFIYIAHTLFIYLTETLTSTKVKNYEASHTYQSILDTLQEKQNNAAATATATTFSNPLLPSGTTPLFLNEELPLPLPSLQTESNTDTVATLNNSDKPSNTMKDELKNFMKQQMN